MFLGLLNVFSFVILRKEKPTELGQTFKVTKWPFAILIDEIGVSRAKGVVSTREQLESLFAAAESGQDLTSLKI
ncbi:hypothetical protein SAMN04488117_10194 [Celeribacter baekdonensis]|uniref:Uncharacterized protein n=1 Tax=Celeribacter baekdonensis TaxID=875171 RepID=A0A1G7FIQ8_9RHOB|nr:hypothetical protein [Celeribacter baekdonensis]SDE75455.1 hypothetical protein SAMN04488117_10194 [Celeribacter baekdonensis]